MKTIAIFGDVGGHYQPFCNGLETVGVDVKNFTIPEDTIIIQLGDLIHKGPFSGKCVDLADRMMKKNPGQWIQLVGNHEGQYLGGPQFWVDEVNFHTIMTLQAWWNTKKVFGAVALSTAEHGPVLVTHAGLSVPWWEQMCDSNPSAEMCAIEINSWPPEKLFHPGSMLGGARPGEGGVAWAHVTEELYETWAAYHGRVNAPEVPFAQIHGHSSAVWWNRKSTNFMNPTYSGTLEADHAKRHYQVTIGGRAFVSTDPGWSAKAWNIQHPYVVHGLVP